MAQMGSITSSTIRRIQIRTITPSTINILFCIAGTLTQAGRFGKWI